LNPLPFKTHVQSTLTHGAARGGAMGFLCVRNLTGETGAEALEVFHEDS
jgi:hypothetical protein